MLDALIASATAVVVSSTWAGVWLTARIVVAPKDPRLELLKHEREVHAKNLGTSIDALRRGSQQRVKEIDREIERLLAGGAL